MRNYYNRLTKIVASVGPASCGEGFKKIMPEGLDVLRFNFSHDETSAHKERYETACKFEKELGMRFSKFADMQGPKHRIGIFKNDKEVIHAGDAFRLDSSEEPGDATRVRLPHPEVLKCLVPGAEVLINDGQIKLEVTAVGEGFVDTKVIIGGPISNRKGFNIPNVLIDAPCITPKDLKDIEAAIEIGFKLIVISFIQTPQDMIDAKKIINGRAKIIAKLEKPEVMKHLSEIIALSDAVMIGRGDFAVEASYPVVPVYHKRIVWECRKQNKPVIVATQMIESMITNPFPTRAEVSDIANAVYEGADCTMLSAESAAGKFPDLAVRMMSDIIGVTESAENEDVLSHYRTLSNSFAKLDASVGSKIDAAVKAGAKALMLINPSLDLVGKVSAFRLSIPVYVNTTDEADEQLFRLYFGIHPTLSSGDVTSADAVASFQKKVAEGLKVSTDSVKLYA